MHFNSEHIHTFQTTSADELAGIDTPMVEQQQQQQQQQPQQHSGPQLQEASLEEPSLSPEELLLAVSRIKQERVDTPPPEENGGAGGGGEEARCVLMVDGLLEVFVLIKLT